VDAADLVRAGEIGDRPGDPQHSGVLNLMTRRVAGCLRDKRERGLVENAPTRGGQYLEWRLA
jgi:hypothetical protein